MGLAERYGMPVNILLKTMSSLDIAECMAFDRLKDEDYRENLEMQNMSQEEINNALVGLIKGVSS